MSEYNDGSEQGIEQISTEEWVPRTVSLWESVGSELFREESSMKETARSWYEKQEQGQGSMKYA